MLLLIRRGVHLLPLFLRQQWHLGLVAIRSVLLPPIIVNVLLLGHAVVILAIHDPLKEQVFILSVSRAAVVGVEEVVLAFDGVVLRCLRLLLPQAGKRTVIIRYDELVPRVLRDHLLVRC